MEYYASIKREYSISMGTNMEYCSRGILHFKKA